MSEISPATGSHRDPVEELVFRYLEERESGEVHDFESFAARHPGAGEEVRKRVEALERAGLMGGEDRPDFPERLGHFRLIERLGGGGMGVVYIAEDTTLGRRVALKLIRPELVYFPQAKERFRREVEAVAKLSHPGIVGVYSFAEEGGVPYFAMELVEGASLGDVLPQFGGRDPSSISGADLARAVTAACGVACAKSPLFDGTWVRSCLELARQVAVALGHAHERGIVHRDVKPSNVMITPDGRARLLDFGLASRAGTTRLTRTGAQLGSMPYMPPELIAGKTDADGPRCDVYSLGVTLHESLALGLPFRGDSTALLAQRISAGEHESVRKENPDVGPDAETICNVAMELDPARRYATADLLAADLACVLERRPIAARRTSRVVRARRWVERNPAVAAASLLGALIVLGGPTGYGVMQGQAAAKERGLNEDLRQANLTVTESNASLASAKADLEAKNVALTDALAREEQANQVASRNFRQALRAVQEMTKLEGMGGYLREVPRFAAVRTRILEKALEFYRGLEHANPSSVEVKREMVRHTRAVGELFADLDRPDDALAELQKAVDMARALLEIDSVSADTRHMFASNLVELALLHHQRGNVDLARSLYEEALTYGDKLVLERTENNRLLHDLSAVHLNLGRIELDAGNLEEAIRHRSRAVEVARDARRRDIQDPAEMTLQLVRSLDGLANCLDAAGRDEEGREYRTEAWTTIGEALRAHPEVRDVKLMLMEVSVNHGLALITRDPEEAERVLKRGYEIGLRMMQDFPEDSLAANYMSGLATNLGYHCANHQRWAESLELLDQAVQWSEARIARDPARLDHYRSLATALACRSQALLGAGRIDEARADADRGIELCAKLLKSRKSDSGIVGDTAVCTMQRAEVECASGDWSKALEFARKSLEFDVRRADVSFQAFEALWHIARAAGNDAALSEEVRAQKRDEVLEMALDQMDRMIDEGFDDLNRLKTLPDYEGLRESFRFLDLVDKLESRS